ncbi:hypothetical protein ACTFR8_22885 [Bacillus cereus group sp. MYBK15-3]|uniref:hypothetical protein n=1 Tax=unclassified Bacillus cereus group TaxID=2750818 RepID=UPI003F78EF14
MSEVKKNKVVIVAGDLTYKEVFGEFVTELGFNPNSGVELPKESNSGTDSDDEELRQALDKLVEGNHSVLIVGKARSGRTTLLKRLVRQKAKANTGVVVMDEVRIEHLSKACEELRTNGVKEGEDVSIIATMVGSNVDDCLDTFFNYCDEVDSDGAVALSEKPIDVVVLMEDGKIVGLFATRKHAVGGHRLVDLDPSSNKRVL